MARMYSRKRGKAGSTRPSKVVTQPWIRYKGEEIPKLPEDITALVKKDIKLVKHLDSNKKDMTVWRGLIITESKINKLAKYYKREGFLPQDWKFDRKTAKLLI